MPVRALQNLYSWSSRKASHCASNSIIPKISPLCFESIFRLVPEKTKPAPKQENNFLHSPLQLFCTRLASYGKFSPLPSFMLLIVVLCSPSDFPFTLAWCWNRSFFPRITSSIVEALFSIAHAESSSAQAKNALIFLQIQCISYFQFFVFHSFLVITVIQTSCISLALSHVSRCQALGLSHRLCTNLWLDRNCFTKARKSKLSSWIKTFRVKTILCTVCDVLRGMQSIVFWTKSKQIFHEVVKTAIWNNRIKWMTTTKLSYLGTIQCPLLSWVNCLNWLLHCYFWRTTHFCLSEYLWR